MEVKKSQRQSYTIQHISGVFLRGVLVMGIAASVYGTCENNRQSARGNEVIRVDKNNFFIYEGAFLSTMIRRGEMKKSQLNIDQREILKRYNDLRVVYRRQQAYRARKLEAEDKNYQNIINEQQAKLHKAMHQQFFVPHIVKSNLKPNFTSQMPNLYSKTVNSYQGTLPLSSSYYPHLSINNEVQKQNPKNIENNVLGKAALVIIGAIILLGALSRKDDNTKDNKAPPSTKEEKEQPSKKEHPLNNSTTSEADFNYASHMPYLHNTTGFCYPCNDFHCNYKQY